MKKERQNPKAEIEGKQALFVVNLKPRKMAGAEGMIFDIGYADKVVPVLALPERPVPNGTRGSRATCCRLPCGIIAPELVPFDPSGGSPVQRLGCHGSLDAPVLPWQPR